MSEHKTPENREQGTNTIRAADHIAKFVPKDQGAGSLHSYVIENCCLFREFLDRFPKDRRLAAWETLLDGIELE